VLWSKHVGMTEPYSETDEHRLLERARAAAKHHHQVAGQVLAFAERLSAVVGPAELLEYDQLIAREAATLSERVDAFARLGLGAGSIDDTGPAAG
jgi:hypothetical protein